MAERSAATSLASTRQRVRASLEFRLGRFVTEPHRFPALFSAARWERTQFRADDETYSEWSLISEPTPTEAGASDALVRLAAAAGVRAIDVDLTPVLARCRRDFERDQLSRWPGEHYRLLVALAEIVEAETIVEVGTFTGASALCFLEASTTRRVISFDVVPWNRFDATLLREDDFGSSLEQRIVDLAEHTAFEAQVDTLAEADLVFVDGPKDGRFEYRFLPSLLATAPRRRQLIVIDDIRVMSMIRLWRSLPVAKLDATTFGHWSGTGLILRSPGAG